MTLETIRLLLLPWQRSDADLLRPIATDPEVMRCITGGVPWSDEQIQALVNQQIELYSQRGFCRWKLLEKPDGDFIGFCGVGFWRNAPDPEIGWWLARHRWGRGLATEAARLALRDAVERAGLDRIVSIARPANTASTCIMQKLEFTLEAEFEIDGVPLVRYARTGPAPAGDASLARALPTPPRLGLK